MSKQDIEKRLGFAAQGVKAKFGRFSTEFGFLANQIKNQPDLAKKNIIVLAKKMGKEVDITRAEFEQLMQYAAKLGMETQVANAHDDVRPGFSRTGAKATFAEFNVGDKVVATPNNHIDAYGRIIKIENGIATIASAEGNVKAKLSDLELVKKGSVEDLRRLGMKGFSRPGVKTEFAADKRTTAGALRKALKAKGITSAADLEWHGISAKDPDSTPYWLYEDGSMEKIKSSRPGAKAKFAKPQFRTKKLHNGYIAVEVNQGSGWERYDTTHEESWNGIEEYERGYQKAYDRGLRYSGGAWRIPSTTASRPGVKTPMAKGWSGTSTKLNRYGDFAVVAASDDGFPKSFSNRTQAQAFSDKHNLGGVKHPSSGGPFYVYMQAPKDSESTTASRPGVKAKMSATFIVAEAIFNAENAVRRGDNENARRWIKAAQDAMDETVVSTGMRSKLEQLVKRYKMSRPGVKAKFDTKVGSKGNKSAMIAKNGPDADASWLAWVVQHHGEGQGESVLGTMRSYSTEARAKAAALRGLETSGLRGGFARPGVKAKA